MENIAIAKQTREKVDDRVEYLPEDIIVAALEYANKVEGTSHMLTTEQVRQQVYSHMGWK